MPQFRKLHTKIVDSLDIDSMSSDFVRLTWTWLQLVACKEGRGLMKAGWLKSKLYPLREDVTYEMLTDAMHEFALLNMVTLYSDGSHDYFQINNWHTYQSTSREAQSSYPAPTQELIKSYSGVGPELLAANASYLFLSNLKEGDSVKGGEIESAVGETITALCNVCENAYSSDKQTLQLAHDLVEMGRGADWVTGFGEWYAQWDNGRPYLKHLRTFGRQYDNNETPHFVKKKNGAGDVDAFLEVINKCQRTGADLTKLKSELHAANVYPLWEALGRKWQGDVRTLTEKQTADLRFRLYEVAQ